MTRVGHLFGAARSKRRRVYRQDRDWPSLWCRDLHDKELADSTVLQTTRVPNSPMRQWPRGRSAQRRSLFCSEGGVQWGINQRGGFEVPSLQREPMTPARVTNRTRRPHKAAVLSKGDRDQVRVLVGQVSPFQVFGRTGVTRPARVLKGRQSSDRSTTALVATTLGCLRTHTHTHSGGGGVFEPRRQWRHEAEVVCSGHGGSGDTQGQRRCLTAGPHRSPPPA